MRIFVTSWCRTAMGEAEWAQVNALRGEKNATLSLIAGSPGGPFTAKLYIPGYGLIRHEGPTIVAVLRDTLADVVALT